MIGSALAKKSNPLAPSLSCQLIQRCWVSGTPKGKGKIKEGKTLKKHKISTKKGSAASAEGGPMRKSAFEEIIDQCLTSTSPLRHLKPKEKAREAEREKMGLISAANKQAKEKLKKLDGKFRSPFPMGPPGFDFITLGAVDVDKIPKYELTVEDGGRLAKEHSRVLFRHHYARRGAEAKFLRCKIEAIEALPEHLKQAALVADLTPFPINRFMATVTPPIEGYMEKISEAAKNSNVKEKLR